MVCSSDATIHDQNSPSTTKFSDMSKKDLQECNVMKFFRNLECTPSWGSCEVETFCPLRHIPSATVAIRTATVLQQSNLRNVSRQLRTKHP